MPIITLLTDFGARDPYAGIMKGVILSIAPRARIVDLCHEVEPFQVGQARFLLQQSWPYFPKGSIHLCVVDPGVGSARRPLLVQAAGHLFIGPDNGLFTGVLHLKGARSRHLTNSKLFLKNVSRTFHGRDIFAPAAAHIAAGFAPAKAGPLVHDALRLTSGAPLRTGRRFFQGEVAHVDRFGNLITNLDSREYLALAEKGLLLRVGLVAVDRLAASYSEVPPDQPALIAGSSGFLEVVFNQASAAKALGAGVGAPVELEVW
ncbi:MAG: SAM-dependent chlorinase/fluorinase [Candidatus Solibacter usitatus]|nr:SAM-dependent chlorinase/fluorinase [Candidatus Solibacter usitatus]